MKMTSELKIYKEQKYLCRIGWLFTIIMLFCFLFIGENTLQFKNRINAVYNAPMHAYTVKSTDNYGRLARRLNAELETPLPEAVMISIIRDINDGDSLQEGDIIRLPYLEESTIV